MQPHAAWIERSYANGAYPHWERVAFVDHSSAAVVPGRSSRAGRHGGDRLANRPFCAPPKAPSRASRALFLNCAAIAGAYALWFELSWGWNYARAPLETRVAFDASRVTPLHAAALRRRAMAEMNALAAAAHARAASPARFDRAASGMAAYGAARRRRLDASRRGSEANRGRSVHARDGNERVHQSAHAKRRTCVGSALVRAAVRPGARVESRRRLRARRRSELSRDSDVSAFARSGGALLGVVRAFPLLAAEKHMRVANSFRSSGKISRPCANATRATST